MSFEELAINKLAEHCRAVTGITNAYSYSTNPDVLVNAQLPAILFYPMQENFEEAAHFNVWKSVIRIRGSLFVTPRMAQGGKLKFIENDVIPFMGKMREKFQSAAVYNELLALGCQRAVMTQMMYGSGGMYLTHAGVEYVGIIVDWEFRITANGG